MKKTFFFGGAKLWRGAAGAAAAQRGSTASLMAEFAGIIQLTAGGTPISTALKIYGRRRVLRIIRKIGVHLSGHFPL